MGGVFIFFKYKKGKAKFSLIIILTKFLRNDVCEKKHQTYSKKIVIDKRFGGNFFGDCQ